MRDCSLFGLLGQASRNEAAAVFQSFIRGHVRSLICRVMSEEVAHLCGPKHQPGTGEHFRAGSSPGRIRIDGRREKLVRPRVRRRTTTSATEEVTLSTYESASDPAQLEASIVAALKGASAVGNSLMWSAKSHGTSRLSVSRLWREVGRKFVSELRSQDLSQTDWVAVMIDGIVLSSDQTAMVVIGINTTGAKQVLDFELGSSENKAPRRITLHPVPVITNLSRIQRPLMSFNN